MPFQHGHMRLHDAFHWIINEMFAMHIAALLCSANFIVDNIYLQDWMSDSIYRTQYRTHWQYRTQYRIRYRVQYCCRYSVCRMISIYLTSGRSRSRIRKGRFKMRIFIRSLAPVMCSVFEDAISYYDIDV
jgi:hypothetical protein